MNPWRNMQIKDMYLCLQKVFSPYDTFLEHDNLFIAE